MGETEREYGVKIGTSWEGEGAGTRFDYGAMGVINGEMTLRGVKLSFHFAYCDMDMQPLAFSVDEMEGEKRTLVYHEWYLPEGERDGLDYKKTGSSDYELLQEVRKLVSENIPETNEALRDILGDKLYKQISGEREEEDE